MKLRYLFLATVLFTVSNYTHAGDELVIVCDENYDCKYVLVIK